MAAFRDAREALVETSAPSRERPAALCGGDRKLSDVMATMPDVANRWGTGFYCKLRRPCAIAQPVVGPRPADVVPDRSPPPRDGGTGCCSANFPPSIGS